MKINFDNIVSTVLAGIYKENIIQQTLALKGGQAIRIAEKIKTRQSSDIDLSTTAELKDYIHFFEIMEKALTREFKNQGLNVIQFKATRRPETRESGLPDFWGGWAIKFKLLENKFLSAPVDRQGTLAVVPDGFASPKIEIDISEYEYCGSIETVKVKSTEVKVYSRPLIINEKLRSLCQQHFSYKHFKNLKPRPRDFYDIDLLYSKSITEGTVLNLIKECQRHLEKVFEAKDVDIAILERIFEEEYLNLLRPTWGTVLSSVGSELESFDYYVDSTKYLVDKILSKKNL